MTFGNAVKVESDAWRDKTGEFLDELAKKDSWLA